MTPISRTPITVIAALTLATWAAGCSRGAGEGAGRREAPPVGGGVERLGGWSERAPLPAPVTNNAVAAVTVGGRGLVFSFLGLDSTRGHAGIHGRAFRYDVSRDRWSEIRGPGRARIAATAQAVRGKIYLFGGYTVAADASEKTLANVDIYDPREEIWSLGAPIPVPVDDATSGVWRDSLIYLVSGWHDRDNVRNVQVYDPFADRWAQATPIPGPGVFGHAGAIVGNTIVFGDGVRRTSVLPRYRIHAAAYRGDIDPGDPTRIDWRELPPHPGPPLYRAAAAPFGSRVIFAGGTSNPYNYDGIGYDGEPSRPSDAVFAFDAQRGVWEAWPPKPLASMDHRAFAVLGKKLFIVGGMLRDQRVTATLQLLELGGR